MAKAWDAVSELYGVPTLMARLDREVDRVGEQSAPNQPVFEVRTSERVYRIWADGRTEGFEHITGPRVVVNRIPVAIARAKLKAIQECANSYRSIPPTTEGNHGQG